MGEESLKRRKGEDKGREDRQSIQSHEPQTMNLQKQANLFLFPWVRVSGAGRGRHTGIFVLMHQLTETPLCPNSAKIS